MRKSVINATEGTEFFKQEGLSIKPEPWEDGLRIDPDSPGAFEWWYFDAHFDDSSTELTARGSTVVITIETRPMVKRLMPEKPSISLTITRPDGTRLMRELRFPFSKLSASKKACDVSVGPNWVRGDLHRYEIHTEVQDMVADLVFTGMVPPWRPGAGKWFYGDLNHYFAWLVAIPYGRVEGALTYDGQTYKVSGTGYHDHNWGNVDMGSVMDHWYWGRAHIGDYTLIFSEQIAAKEYGFVRMPVFMLAKGNRILTDDARFLTMKVRDFEKYPGRQGYPRQIDFDWISGSDKAHFFLRNPRLIEDINLLSFPLWKQWLARFLIGNAGYFRFNGDLELTIDIDGIRTNERGKALHEIMIFQGKKYCCASG